MRNITINGQKRVTDLERKVSLNNGALVMLKENDKVTSVYMVVSFRDNKNRYGGDDTSKYCTLVNLDSGNYSFEERCSRYTTVRRVLNHLLKLGNSSRSYNESIPVEQYGNTDIEVVYSGDYTIDIVM